MSKEFVPADIVIYKVKDKSRIKEPSLVAYDKKTSKVLAVGKEAAKINCDGEEVGCVSPFHFGVIEDFQVANVLMKLLIKREFKGLWIKPRFALCFSESKDVFPMGIYEDLLKSAGARSVDIFNNTTLDEFLENIKEDKLSEYTGIIWITKENVNEYANELIEETYEQLKKWGISKEEMIGILHKVDA